jgi:hypothetical protein
MVQPGTTFSSVFLKDLKNEGEKKQGKKMRKLSLERRLNEPSRYRYIYRRRRD